MSALEILTAPPNVFYNDGKARKFEVELMLQGSNHAQLAVTLLYERGDRVEDQSILEAVPGNALYLRAGRQATLAYRINQVSSKHLNRKFRLQFACDGAVVETNAIEVKAKPPRKHKSNGVSAPVESNKRRKTSPMSTVVVPSQAATTSEPMLNVLRQIESNQLHILQRVSTLEQLLLRNMPQLAQNVAPMSDSPTQRTRQPLAQTLAQGHGQNIAPGAGQPDSMGLESLCARILEQQNSIGAGGGPQQGGQAGGRTSQVAIPSGLVSNNLVQDSGSIGGWIQDSLSALTWNFNKLPRSNLGEEAEKKQAQQALQQQALQQQSQQQQPVAAE